jgi:hypothetical protein
MPLREINADFKIPGIGGISGKWDLNDAERSAAWKLLLQLGTRTTITPLAAHEGLIREALGSLYRSFDITREILALGGTDLARDKPSGEPSLAAVAALILNDHIRPVLSRWHPMLLDYEAVKPDDVGPLTWERGWEHHDAARADLTALREVLRQYLGVLGQAAGTETFARALMPDA